MEMETLTCRCEEFCLQEFDANNIASLSECVSTLSIDIVPHLSHFEPFFEDEEVMDRLWPSIVRVCGFLEKL